MTDHKTEFSSEDLLKNNQALREELSRLKVENQTMFNLLVETTRRLQATSTSIKAAVSSLLNYDILWDASNQHEFLQTINISADLLTDLVTLLALRFRVQAGELELKCETQSLKEIISAVQVKGLKHAPNHPVEVNFIGGEELVKVDYVYLPAALELLVNVISARAGSNPTRIQVEEKGKNWMVQFMDIDPELVEVIRIKNYPQKEILSGLRLSSENVLKLYTALDLIQMQDIQVDLADGLEGKQSLILSVPAADS
ncbi:MAG: hypothetical protein LWX83_02855 [Anaerolineae bacterium]|nr:hypothetical protein [Anaerolineae bacterium]